LQGVVVVVVVVVVALAVCLFAVQSVFVLQVRGRCNGEGRPLRHPQRDERRGAVQIELVLVQGNTIKVQ
jgi:hypothetical protein